MRAVTYISHRGCAFDVLTQEYDMDDVSWRIKVVYSYDDGRFRKSFMGEGKAKAYELAATRAVRDCIEKGLNQKVFDFGV